jgi:hypothetical protein
VVCVIKRERERERERENVSGALLENAFERELKMKDTSQIGKIAYEFLSLSLSLFPLFLSANDTRYNDTLHSQ